MRIGLYDALVGAASAVGHFRRPARVERHGGDVELAALVANVPGAIYRCALDADWTMSVISAEIERISGYSPSDFILSSSRTFASIIHTDDRADVEREVRTATTEDRPFALEYRIVRADTLRTGARAPRPPRPRPPGGGLTTRAVRLRANGSRTVRPAADQRIRAT